MRTHPPTLLERRPRLGLALGAVLVLLATLVLGLALGLVGAHAVTLVLGLVTPAS